MSDEKTNGYDMAWNEGQEPTMTDEKELRELVEQWRKNADEARNQHMASWLNHCADELEAVLDE